MTTQDLVQDQRIQTEKDAARAAELRNRNWKVEYDMRRGDYDAYEANLPVVIGGRLYNKKTGKLWSEIDQQELDSLRTDVSLDQYKNIPSEKLAQMAGKGEIGRKTFDAVLKQRKHKYVDGRLIRSMEEQRKERILRGGV